MSAAPQHFADGCIERVRALGHPLCLGLDPHLDRIPPSFRRGAMAPGDPATAAAVESFLCAVIERYAGRVAVAKPQIAFFEQLGWRGLELLGRVLEKARAAGLRVLLDAKRGDVGSTAAAYAAAYLAPDAPLAADAITVNAYLGRDALEPFVACAERAGRGLFVVVRTSNPGAGDLQDRDTGGRPLYQALAASLAGLAGRLAGPATGWSSLGVVAAATWPEEAERIRALLPNALFLVPGYGAQGGSARAAVRGFVPGPHGRLEGGLVAASRALLYPACAGDGARAWESAIDEARDRAIGELAEATSAGGGGA